EADERPLLDGLAEALVARRDVLTRDRAADDLVDELVVPHGVGRERLEVAADFRVLTGAAGLLLMRIGDLRAAGDRLAIRDLRLAGDDFAVVLALHALDVNVEVKLAHAADDGLLRLLILVHAEGRVLLREAVQGLREVRLGATVLRGHGQRDDGRG